MATDLPQAPDTPARPATGRFGQPTSLPSISGRVVEETTATPLGGVIVGWVFDDGEGETRPRRERAVQIGEGRSGDDGAFSISPAETPEAREALCELESHGEAMSYLTIDGGERGVLRFPVDAGPEQGEIVIRVPGAGYPNEEDWAALSAYLASNRMIRTDDAVRQFSGAVRRLTDRRLASPRARGRDRDGRSIARRRPGRRCRHRPSRADAPPESRGAAGRRRRQGRDQFPRRRDSSSSTAAGSSDWLDGIYFKLPKSDLELYRDYLIGVWVGAARLMHAAKPAPMPSDAALEAQLGTRFHQNFRTADVDAQAGPCAADPDPARRADDARPTATASAWPPAPSPRAAPARATPTTSRRSSRDGQVRRRAAQPLPDSASTGRSGPRRARWR